MERRLRSWPSWLVVLAILAAAPRARALDDPAQRLLVVYNATEPEGEKLAAYYMERRHIPHEHLCVIHVRAAETITREEYNEQIRQPILQFMLDHSLIFQLPETVGGKTRTSTFDNKIDYLVLLYGVPLRIEEDGRVKETVPANLPAAARRNQASVDSELTVLPSPDARLTGWLPNPFFNSNAIRFGPPLNNVMLLVTRLDGPDPETVRRMIDDSIATERHGLLGRCYFDARDTHEAGYLDGDRWIKDSYKLFQAAGYECDLEDTAELYPVDYPMTDAAIYAGWYAGNVTGPFQRDDFQFRRGAIAYHLHSSSAARIRTRNTYWVGPLLARGAAASFGHVFEPYLAMTPHLDVFFKRLLDGANFATAGWASQAGLSWQTTFVGDPLYRPFPWSVDEQIARLELDKGPDLEWAYLRKVNLLLADHKDAEAEKLCRDKAAGLKSLVLQEKLGDILHESHRETDAADVYQEALKRAGDKYRDYRIGMKLAGVYEADRQPALAVGVYEGLAAVIKGGGNMLIILQKGHDAARLAGDTAKAEAFQQKLEDLIAGNAEKKK